MITSSKPRRLIASWIADDALDRRARRVLEQRNRQLDHLLGLALRLVLGIDDHVQAVRRVRHEQGERRGAALRAFADGLQQGRGGGGLVGDDEDACGRRGLHAEPLLSRMRNRSRPDATLPGNRLISRLWSKTYVQAS
jgi:hypothetical protein